MNYHYNLYGWFDGQVPDGADRSTPDIPPPAVGDMQPNWTGHRWVLDQYKEPPPADVLTTPESVTMRQARLALLAAGLLDTIEGAVVQMPRAAQIEWEFASEVRRDSPLIGQMSAAMGLTSEQLDQLFRTAAGL